VEQPWEKSLETRGSEDAHRSQGKHDPFELQGSSDGELYSASRTDRKRDPVGLVEEAGHWGLKEVKDDTLEKKMHHSLSEHASREQSQHSNASLKSTVPGSVCKTAIEATTSFYSTYPDGRIPTPTISSYRKSDGGKAVARERSKKDTTFAAIANGIEEDPQEPTSSASMILTAGVITAAKATSTDDSLAETQELSYDGAPHPQPAFYTAGSVGPIVLLPPQGVETQDELSLPLPDTKPALQEPSPKGAQRKEADNDHAEEVGSDDKVIGLPKDLYKPRPSRSRGGNKKEEILAPTDWSERPETAQRKKRNNKEQDFTLPQGAILNDERHHHNEVDHPSEEGKGGQCKQNNEDERKITTFEVPGRDSTKAYKKKGALSDEEEMETGHDTEEESKAGEEPLLKQPKPRKQRGRPKKEAQVLEDMPKEDRSKLENECAAGNNMAAPTKILKPQKRGRPSKESMTIVREETDDEAGEGDDEEGAIATKRLKEVKTSLEETTGNKTPTKDAVKVTPVPPETPPKQAAPSSKGPHKHSPINSGTVKYRVGLSKRARIQPLLSIVRK